MLKVRNKRSIQCEQVLGHLAAEVAKWLGPLVIGNMVEAAGTVQDEPASSSAPINVSIQVQLCWSRHASQSGCEAHTSLKRCVLRFVSHLWIANAMLL